MIEVLVGVIALVVACVSVYYARKQVEIAQRTKSETEKLLEKINPVAN